MQNQNGRSMIEMLGVLAIIGVLSVGGIAGYSKAMEKFKINKTIEQISTIANNVRTTFMSQGNYQGLDTLLAHNAGIIPDEMWDEDNGSAHNVWGETFDILLEGSDYDEGAEDDSVFAIMTRISSDSACIELLTHNWSAGGQPVLADAYGNGWDLFAVSPVSPAKAAEMCEKTKEEDRRIYLYYEMNFNSDGVQYLLNGCGNEDGNCY